MSKNMFALPGSGGVRANARRAEQAEIERQNLVREQLARRLGLWSRGTSILGKLPPINLPTLRAYNPAIDVEAMGRNLYEASLATSNQSLADQFAELESRARHSLGSRGLSTSTFAPGTKAQLSILRGQGTARNLAAALAQRYALEQGLRGETAGYQAGANELAQQAYLNEADRYGRNLALAQYLLGMGDPTASAADLGNVSTGFQNIAGQYGQMGANAMAGLSNLASFGGSLTGGGIFSRPSRPPPATGASMPAANWSWSPAPLPTWSPSGSRRLYDYSLFGSTRPKYSLFTR